MTKHAPIAHGRCGTLMLLLLGFSACASYASPEAEKYLSWMKANGVELHPQLEYSVEAAGPVRGAKVSADISAGTRVAKIPLSACLSIAAVKEHPALQEVLAEASDSVSPPVALALLLMAESARGPESRWQPFIDALPPALGTTAYWGEEDLQLLQGTSVLRETAARLQDLTAVFSALKPLLSAPQGDTAAPILPDFTMDGFARFVTITLGRTILLRSSDAQQTVVPVLAPFIEDLQRSIGNSSTFSIATDPGQQEEDKAAAATASDEYLVITTSRAFTVGEQLAVFHGTQSNKQLLLNQGSFVDGNPYDEVSLSVKLPQTDPYWQIKAQMLATINVTDGQRFSFIAGLNGQPPLGLLKTMRIQFLRFSEFGLFSKIVDSAEPVSLYNELMVYRTLLSVTEQLLTHYNSTVEEDLELLKDHEAAELDSDARLSSRHVVAVKLRLQEKRILLQSRLWMHEAWNQMLSVDSLANLADVHA